MKTIFLTGASSGIGRGLAIEYAKRGAHLALAARRVDELELTKREVESAGGRAIVFGLDVTDAAQVSVCMKQAAEKLGSLDLVIANAGTAGSGSAATQSWETVKRIVDVNITGAMATLMAAVPIMVAHRSGHLACVTSLAGRRALPGFGAYSASKAAMSTFLEALRLDLSPIGIRVTDIRPGFVDTPLVIKGRRLPLLWSVDDACQHIVRRMDRAPAVLAFPWPLVWLTSIARVFPNWLYDRTVRLGAGN